MISPYVLLCSPYRFSSAIFQKLDRETVEKEWLSAIMPGTNTSTRPLLKMGLSANYGIEDAQGLLTEVARLEAGDYRVASEDVAAFIESRFSPEMKQIILVLQDLAGERGIQGFDDCRIIDVLTKAYAARLIDQASFDTLFAQQTQRIGVAYTSWQQYLASCVLGKLVQLVPASWSVTSQEEYLMTIYALSVSPTPIFTYGDFWENSDLTSLIGLLETILGPEVVAEVKTQQELDARTGIPGLDRPSDDLAAILDEFHLDPQALDLQRFRRISQLAEHVLWQPLVDQNLEWFISEKNGKEQAVLLMPQEFASYESAKWFWQNYPKYQDLHDEQIFAMLDGTFSLNAILTEKGIYQFKKKLFGKPSRIFTPWSEVVWKVNVDSDMGTCEISLGKKKVFDVFVSFDDLGLTAAQVAGLTTAQRRAFDDKWTQEMASYLETIPQRLQANREN